MPYTISDARSQVLEHLDNESGSRYAPGGDNTKIDRNLRLALTMCLDDYVKAGGDKFDEEITFTTDATGSVDLSTSTPLAFRGVLLEPSSGSLCPVQEGDRLTRGVPDLSVRNFRAIIVKTFTIAASPGASDLLVGTTAGAARSWEAFDEWVCMRAARSLGIKDLEAARQEQLTQALDDIATSCTTQQRNPRVLPWPTTAPLWYRDLRWCWIPRTLTMSFYFDRVAF